MNEDNVLRTLGMSLEFISGASLFSVASFFRCVTDRTERRSEGLSPSPGLSPTSALSILFLTLSSSHALLPRVKIPGPADLSPLSFSGPGELQRYGSLEQF